MENSILNAPIIRHKSTPSFINFLDNTFSLDNFNDYNADTYTFLDISQENSSYINNTTSIQTQIENEKNKISISFKWRSRENKQNYYNSNSSLSESNEYINFPLYLELDSLFFKDIESPFNFYSR